MCVCVCVERARVSAREAHPLLPLRALIHECEEVEVRRVGLRLAGLDQPADVAVDPRPGAALEQISLVGVGAIPQLLGSRPHGPPLVEKKKTNKQNKQQQQINKSVRIWKTVVT